MNKCIVIICSVMYMLFAFVANAQTDSTKKSCTNAGCHANIIANEVVHDAIKRGCEKCHQSNGQSHPTKDGKNFTLTKEIPKLCYSCHDENNTMSKVHPPVAKGNCLECHTPHSSPESNLLRKYPTSQVCFQCHKLESAAKKFKHQPVEKGECAKCHDPHQSETEKFLVDAPPKLCLKCHEPQAQQMKKENVHPPFKNNCLYCHSQHSSNEAKLLDLTGQSLCVYCHDDIQKKLDKSSVVHGAVADKKSCLNCHSPHATDQEYFLLAPSKELCLSCHNKGIVVGGRKIANIEQTLSKAKSVHKAIEKSGCIGCHDPHASANQSLLLKAMPEGSYAVVNNENFALCFGCHKPEMIEKQQTNSVTEFRNGDKNLHYVHVHGEKGRSCLICHNPHGSPNEHLVNEKAPFGKWEMPMKYKVLENGGSCAPGCHEERKYDRVSVIK